MNNIDWRISIGNILSLLITLIGMAVGGLFVVAELRVNDKVSDNRFVAIEKKIETYERDREILVEIRTDLKALRSELNRGK